LIGSALVRGYDTKAKIGRVRAPILAIHGDRDEVIAYEFGQELFQAAPEPKAFWAIRGATHNDLHVSGAVEFPGRLKAFYVSLAQNVVDHSQ
jgi:fermentation-respiration switch protein FrsA (DUF1100 family)